MAVEVHVPNKSYSGVLSGVHFHRGIGVFEDEAKARELAEQFGFEVIAAGGQEEKAEPVEEKPKAKRKPRKKVVKEAE
ncbi:hypothetical protein [Priestia megaterium]|uniref:hypothetical protein n=1 Tax=Priestia megaterium TaxID=1404 RepID=UPI00285AA463|nr:hypothetical protein [Priestia megaterium]MDR7207594.1 hypothetical protein [Priestia megaterium]